MAFRRGMYGGENFFSDLSVTAKIILINVAVFAIFYPLFALNVIPIDYIAIKPGNILEGNYLWTFFTAMFMHAGFFHILANMFSLFFVGTLVERLVGARRYILFYLISGIFASLFFVASVLIFPQDINTYAVGASGALFGLVGILMLLTPDLPVYVMLIPLPVKMKYAGPGILALLWVISIIGDIPIGNMAHFGGLLAGVVYGIYLKNKFPRKTGMIRKHFR
ncbi:MAG TPA: rhomboid family intramembrane serine protease [Candidatus Nanoarchaeia archaeon]|nr:rhomboid family intramembrane serine protease [Candidatus Nanoarchaeia archaeon]